MLGYYDVMFWIFFTMHIYQATLLSLTSTIHDNLQQELHVRFLLFYMCLPTPSGVIKIIKQQIFLFLWAKRDMIKRKAF